MSGPSDARAFWDAMFTGDAYTYGETPDDYLVKHAGLLRPGMRALVPGDGEGRHGVYLAEQGLDVVTVDISAIGRQKAEQLAGRRGVTISALQADLRRWNWPDSQFDVVASFFLHVPPDDRRLLHQAMLRALRPGGYLIIKGFRREQIRYRQQYGSHGGPPDEAMLFSPDMLRNDFARADEIELMETDVQMGNQTRHTGMAAVVQGVFRMQASTLRMCNE